MQKKESAERKMSKIKTKKVLTPEQKKKRIRNIIIVAVILVAASIATYWMQPQNKALAESEVFSEEEVKSQETETNSQEKLIGVAIFILLLPIFTVFIFAILQSNWLSDFEIFKGYKEVFRESTSIQLIVEKCTPLAMASTVIFVAAGAAIIIQKICKYLNSKKFGHPQALLAVIIEIIFFIALPRLKEINPFDSLLETMVEGGFSNTLVALAIFFIVIWLFLIMLSVPSDTEKTNNLENEIREECKTLFSDIQKIALGLLKSGIGLIRFATTDYIEAILGVFGIEEKKTDNLDKK